MIKVPRGKWYCHGCAGKAPPPRKRGPKKVKETKEQKDKESKSNISSQSNNTSIASPIAATPTTPATPNANPNSLPTMASTPITSTANEMPPLR